MDKNLQKGKEILKQHKSNNTASAEKAAEADIKKDLDLTPSKDKANDLDEGELALFEGER